MGNKFKDIYSQAFGYIGHLLKPSFLSSRNSSISLDMGSMYVKAISLEENNQEWEITGFSCIKVDSNLKDTVKKAILKLPVKQKELAMSLSGHNLVLRYVTMPIMSQEEVVKSMTFELEKYIPFNKEEINFDFNILTKNKTTGKMSVLIAAAKKDLINKKIGLCSELGYRPKFIDVCPLAIANFFEYSRIPKEKEVCTIVNLGASISSVDVFEEGQLVLSRDIYVGGNDFTKKIAGTINKEFNAAEEIKLNSLTEDLMQSLEPIYSNLIKELKVSFDFYETQSNRAIDKILITGGTAYLKGMQDSLKQSLGQDVEMISFDKDKFKLNSSLNVQEFEKDFNLYTTALGVAIRDFK
ncbi:MAG: type IV pilus assembly protein PilM [Candidatus Omnitrophota bacterium]